MESLYKHEWENRLGAIGCAFQGQSRSIRDFVDAFEDKLSAEDRRMLRRIATEADDLAKDIGIVERRCD